MNKRQMGLKWHEGVNDDNIFYFLLNYSYVFQSLFPFQL